MATEQNKNLVKQLFNDVINQNNVTSIDNFIGSNFVNHGIPNASQGAEGFKQIVTQFTDAFPDLKVTQDEVIGEGESVAARGTWTGTHKGNFMNIPATGKHVKVAYIDFWKIENGKAVENWVQMDIMGLMQQLGVM